MNRVSMNAVSRHGYPTAASATGLLCRKVGAGPLVSDRRPMAPAMPMVTMPRPRADASVMPVTMDIDAEKQAYLPLVVPAVLKRELPADAGVRQVVADARAAVRNILTKKDPRLLVIAGPCSIHDERSALDYARRLAVLGERVAGTMFVVMRTYFEKPRTCTGWKGLINDPHLDGTCDLALGLSRARKILLAVNGMGLPAAAEMLDPATPAYIGDLISWAAVGARTTESQIHREMASGLAMPVGFKNGTDGDLTAALNAVRAAAAPQTFPGLDQSGRSAIVKTDGNPWAHMVLRGGKHPNYHSENVAETRRLLKEKRLPEAIVIDCSHGNSEKDHRRQSTVWNSVIGRRLEGDDAVVGLMLESHLHEGRQPFADRPSALAYGVSVTDACIGWEETERLLLNTHQRLQTGLENRPADAWINDGDHRRRRQLAGRMLAGV